MKPSPAGPGQSSRCFLLRGSLRFPQNQTAQPGAIHPFLPCHNPSRRCSTGVTAWSPCRRMLGGNHGNGQVSLSLPLPITLRCHHVLATSRAPCVPPRSCPRAVLVYVARGTALGIPTVVQGLDPGVQHHPGTPSPRGWTEEGTPTPSCRRVPTLAVSLPCSPGRRSPARRSKQHLQVLIPAAGLALPEIALRDGRPCQR